jgi:hypothetical protein
MRRARAQGCVVWVAVGLCAAGIAWADVRFFVYNLTTSVKFTEVYLAPSGTGQWSTNQTLNDKDRVLDPGERLALLAGARGVYDVKFIDPDGRVCIKSGVDLMRETSLDIRDTDLASCLAGDKGKGDRRP